MGHAPPAGSASGNLGIMLRMLGALQTIASLTASPHRQRALHEQVQWIAELAERTVESAHDRAKIDTRVARVHKTLEADPALVPRGGEGTVLQNRAQAICHYPRRGSSGDPQLEVESGRNAEIKNTGREDAGELN